MAGHRWTLKRLVEMKVESVALTEALATVLKAGDVALFNAYRAEVKQRHVHWLNLGALDLRGAQIPSVDFRSTQLKEADLREANLQEAVFSGGWFQGIDLRGADLRGANLSNARIMQANLQGADLREANLRRAELGQVNLRQVRLAGADFSFATLDATEFVEVDLSGARHLDTLEHLGPSILSRDTLSQSGALPPIFLEGCGLPPDVLAQSAPPQSVHPHDLRPCFVSHGPADQKLALHLIDQLRAGGLRVWQASTDAKQGVRYREQIDAAITQQGRFLLIVSRHSLRDKWAASELRRARQHERETGRRLLFPICVMSLPELAAYAIFNSDVGRDLLPALRQSYLGNFSNWEHLDRFTPLFDKLLSQLR